MHTQIQEMGLRGPFSPVPRESEVHSARPSPRPRPNARPPLGGQRRTVSAASIYTRASAARGNFSGSVGSAASIGSAGSSPARPSTDTPSPAPLALVLDTSAQRQGETLGVHPLRSAHTPLRSASAQSAPDNYPNGPLLVVPPNIYLYHAPSTAEAQRFSAVVNCAEEIPPLDTITYTHLPWTHESHIAGDLRTATERLHDAAARGPVLVHCACGVSRSACLVVAYIMRYAHCPFAEAYAQLCRAAPAVSPNLGLVGELLQWQRMLEKTSS